MVVVYYRVRFTTQWRDVNPASGPVPVSLYKQRRRKTPDRCHGPGLVHQVDLEPQLAALVLRRIIGIFIYF